MIGAGNMARALARGWREPLLISDGGSGRAAILAAEHAGQAVAHNAELAASADVVVLCHKPGQLQAVADEIAPRARTVISLLAATPVSALRAALPRSEVVRAMPNMAVEVRQGVTCVAADPDVQEPVAALARQLFERLGSVVLLPEPLMDVATALSGVAPAYMALVAEAQIDAAIRRGLPGSQACEIALGALAGSAAMLRARGGDTLAVRREVASPGGLTARGLEALERAGLRAAFADAMTAVLDGAHP